MVQVGVYSNGMSSEAHCETGKILSEVSEEDRVLMNVYSIDTMATCLLEQWHLSESRSSNMLWQDGTEGA